MPIRHSSHSGPLRIAIIGFVHQHVEGLLAQAARRDDLQIVGVYERDRALFARFAAKYGLSDAIRYDDLDRMLDETRPEAVSVMSSIRDHLAAVEACAPRGVHLLLEKPLAFSNADARRMAELAAQHGVLVLTNYETSWYASVRAAKAMVAGGEPAELVRDSHLAPAASSGPPAPLRRMVFRHGHRGPIEIGCMPEFLAWLTNPNQNGGGALVDFGCYGAILATWLMDGARPTHIAASATTLKPNMYPRVDDDATIVLTYPTATAVIQASWCWTHDNKEMDLYMEHGSIHARKWDALEVRAADKPVEAIAPPPKPEHLRDEWTYLRQVIRGKCEVDPLSSLELNLIAVEILDAARGHAAARRIR